MRHHNSDPYDALNDYLDSLAGAPSPNSHARDLDSDMRDGVDRFFDLAERAGIASADTRRPDMNTTLPASTVLAPTRKTRRSVIMPAWTRHLHLLSTGLLLVAVIALSFATFGPNGIGNRGSGNEDTGDGPSLNGAVPIATVPEDTETSSIPYPTADECTVEPMTREEVLNHLHEANSLAEEPEQQRYERPIEPTDDEAKAIMQTFREWQACRLEGRAHAYRMQLETPWYTANQSALFRTPDGGFTRPVSDAEIEAWVDIMLTSEEYPATPPAIASTPVATPEPQLQLPIPPGRELADSGPGGPAVLTIFPEDIVITGPDTASVTAHFVNPDTRQVMPSTPMSYEFVNVDGEWRINFHRQMLG